MNRREFTTRAALTLASVAAAQTWCAHAAAKGFRLKYMVGSSMYGELPLDTILPEVRKSGAEFLDVWPRVHGNQREQMDAMGHDQFGSLLEKHQVRLGCLTRYDLGPFGLGPEMPVARHFGCRLMVCGGRGPKGLKGGELKTEVRRFAQQMKPHLERAGDHGVTIAIENHGNNLIDSPDSLKWLIEFRPADNLRIALAPYHLESLDVTAADLGKLFTDLGNEIAIFYAWQHGMGCVKKLPKEQELLQLPGRGDFDFAPTLEAMRRVDYRGFTEIFMHPVPRGIPILPTAAETTAEINRAREYLENQIQ